MTKQKQTKKLIDDFLFYLVWLVALVAFMFVQANTLAKFRAEQNRVNETTEICIEPSC